MNRWAALVEIVKSFNQQGKHGYAFAAVSVFSLTMLLIAALASIGAVLASKSLPPSFLATAKIGSASGTGGPHSASQSDSR